MSQLQLMVSPADVFDMGPC